jgi:hypothetical protein
MVVLFRGCIASFRYTKSLLSKSNENELGAVTLMSTDVDRLITSLTALTQIWGHIASVAIGTWLLWRQLGIVALVPWCIVCLCSVAQGRYSTINAEEAVHMGKGCSEESRLNFEFATRNQIRKASRYDRYHG